MSIPIYKLMPLITKLGSYLKLGLDQYAFLKNQGKEANADIIAAFLLIKMADWDPVVGEKSLLDDPTREAAARFLSGVAINFAAG